VAPSEPIEVTLDDVPLADVVRLFSRISGANIVAATTNLRGSVTANLKGVAWRPAFESILDRQNMTLVEKPPASNIFVVEPRPAGAPDPRVSETFRLKYAKVADVTKVLQDLLGTEGLVVPFPAGNSIVVHASAVKLSEVRGVLEQVDQPRSQVYIEAKFVELSDGSSKRLGIDWQFLNGLKVTTTLGYEQGRDEISERYTARGGSENSTFSSSKGSTRNNTANSIRYYDMDGNEVETDPATLIPPPLTAPGPTRPTTTKTAATVADKASASTYDTTAFSEFLRTDDILKGSTLGAILSAPDLALVLSLMKTEEGVSVISNPKVIVANEEKAVIDMTTKEPYVVVSRQKGTEQSPGDTITTTLSVIPGKSEPFVGEAFFSYGITVNVTPRVNTASNITVTIEPSISKRIGTAATPGDTVYPIIEMKKITTIFSLGDGRTAAIGGLTRTEDQDIVKKVPLLGDIPILGKYLFSHSERVKQQKEIIIFVTVGVVTSESASGVSLPEGAKLVQQHVDSDGHLIKAPAAGDAAKAKDKKEKPAAE
jgi:type IV pilus assembly protein PilQ